MNGFKLESGQCVKDLGVSIASNLKFSQQCKDAASKANRMLGFIHRYFSFKNKDIIPSLYTSLVRPYLEMLWNFGHTTYTGHSKIRNCPEKGYKGCYIPK